jgi:hypothetical protein
MGHNTSPRRCCHGPEHDFIAEGQANGTAFRYVAEAKWDSDIDGNQGAAGNQSQLHFRWLVAQGSGPAALPSSQCGVLVLVPSPDLYLRVGRPVFSSYFARASADYVPLQAALGVHARAVTWEHVASFAQSTAPDVADYLRWRLTLLAQGQSSPGGQCPP